MRMPLIVLAGLLRFLALGVYSLTYYEPGGAKLGSETTGREYMQLELR